MGRLAQIGEIVEIRGLKARFSEEASESIPLPSGLSAGPTQDLVENAVFHRLPSLYSFEKRLGSASGWESL